MMSSLSSLSLVFALLCAVGPTDASDLNEFDNLRRLDTIDDIQRIVYGAVSYTHLTLPTIYSV